MIRPLPCRTRLAALCLLAASCTPQPSSPEAPAGPSAGAALPRADLEGAEPLVAARIRESMEAARARPGDAGAWGLLGMDLEAHSFPEQALQCYRTAARLDTEDYRWPYLTALQLAREDPAASLEWFERAGELSADNPAVAIHHGSTLLAVGRPSEARARFEAAGRQEQARPWSLHGLALVALRENEPQRALELLDEAVQAAPDMGQAHALRARILNRLGRRDEAELAGLASRAYPDPAAVPDPVAGEVRSRGVGSQAWTARGLRLERAGDLEGAEAAFRKVLSIRPGDARDFSNLGGVLARQGRTEEAVQQYRKALEVNPRDAFTHNNLAMTYLSAGEIDSAEEHLEEAVRAEPSFANAHYNLGIVAARRGDRAAAEEDLRRALELDPAHRGALNSLGTALVSSGREEEGLAVWRRAAAIDPMNIDSRYNLAMALARRGDHPEAVSHLEAALLRAPNSSLLLRVLAWELATAPQSAVRDGERAVELATRVYGRYAGDPQVGDILAAALAEDGQMARAIATAERALRAAESAGKDGLAGQIRSRLETYRAGRPFRQPGLGR